MKNPLREYVYRPLAQALRQRLVIFVLHLIFCIVMAAVTLAEGVRHGIWKDE